MPYLKKDPLQQPSAINGNADLLKNVATGAKTLYGGLRTGVVPSATPATPTGVIGSFNTPADTGIRGSRTNGGQGQGLRSGLLGRPQYDSNFARQAKRVLSKRGLTKAQRDAQLGSLKATETMRQYGVDPEGDQGRQILDLNRAANKRGLTSSMRADLLGLSGDILDNAVEPAQRALQKSERNQGNATSFEESLLKELDALDGGY